MADRDRAVWLVDCYKPDKTGRWFSVDDHVHDGIDMCKRGKLHKALEHEIWRRFISYATESMNNMFARMAFEITESCNQGEQ